MSRNIVILSVCILVLASACQVVPKEIGRASQELPNQPGLSGYVGLDLRTLERSERKDLQRTFKKLTGVEVKTGSHELRPWWLSEYRSGKTRWILFEGYEGFDIPDISAARIHLFGENWDYLGSSAFPTGYRRFLVEAKVVREPVLEMDVIEIGTSTLGGYGDRQVYVTLGDRVALVRLEDDEQNIVRNSYITEVPFTGTPAPKRTVEQWQQSLDSKSPCEVLETLVWSSGMHLSSDEERISNVNQESLEDSELFETVRSSPEVKQKLLVLRNSPSIWIRQAAELAIAHEQPEQPRNWDLYPHIKRH